MGAGASTQRHERPVLTEPQSLKVEKANLEHRVKQLEADAHDAEEELKLLRQQLASVEKERQLLRRKLDEVDRAHQRESETARREFLIAMRRMSEQRDAAESALKDDRMDTQTWKTEREQATSRVATLEAALEAATRDAQASREALETFRQASITVRAPQLPTAQYGALPSYLNRSTSDDATHDD